MCLLEKAKPAEPEPRSNTGPWPLAATVYTEGPKKPAVCGVCSRDPSRMNSPVAECSHCDCPHRGRAWSDRPKVALPADVLAP